jgi:hypothetical protein
METLTPVYTARLFPALHAELIALLRGLAAHAWAQRTVAPQWRVRDVVAHLLDGDLRKLAGGRDAHRVADRPVSSFADVVNLVNELNASGVRYAERLSPRLITDLLEVTGGWVSDFIARLDPDADAHIAVAWAGEQVSANWMDTAREYTERWHHQMQIREAVGAAPLLQRQWFHPVLDVSVRAFARAFQNVAGSVGTVVVFEVEAEGEPAWSVVRDTGGWAVRRGRGANPAACVRADADTAWKLLFNALPLEAARARVTISGNRMLAEPILNARSVMV